MRNPSVVALKGVIEMAKSLADRSSEELEVGLQKGEFGSRKAAFAKEILRRREKARGGLKYIFVSGILAVVTFGMALFNRLWRRQESSCPIGGNHHE
jgi:hypothetical protein